jgi:glutaredoxin
MQARRVMRWTLTLALLIAGAAHAQLYRWTDEKGRVHVTDTPPPASARSVQKTDPGVNVGKPSEQQAFELQQAMKEFPVVLYTSPSCKTACTNARSALNKRGVPFKEVQVWEEKGIAELKGLSGANSVPTLLVGRSVHKGFQQDAYDALLDSARYPKAGTLPARAQAAPPIPEGFDPIDTRAEPVKPAAEEPKPSGPYAPGSTPPRRTPEKK